MPGCSIEEGAARKLMIDVGPIPQADEELDLARLRVAAPGQLERA